MSNLNPRGEQSTSQEISLLSTLNEWTNENGYIVFDENYALFPTTIWRATGSTTIANTTTETTLLPSSGAGTKVVPANFFIAGRTIQIRVMGHIGTTGGVTAGRLRVKVGATTVVDTTMSTIVSMTGTRTFEAIALITCRSAGASGSFIGQGYFDYNYTNSANAKFETPTTAASTIDTSVALTLNMTFEWQTANASNTITATNAIITNL